jgi:hypothetical protein
VSHQEVTLFHRHFGHGSVSRQSTFTIERARIP